MKRHAYRSIVIHREDHPAHASTRLEPREASRVAAMDDWEEEEELVSLLILREDRLRGIPGFASRKNDKGEAA